MNKSIMMGRLVRDPEIRYTQAKNGELAIASFRIAVNRKFVGEDGINADFFSISAFGRLAEFTEKYLFQGVKVVVTGRMQNDNYKNRAGEQVYGMRLMAEDIEFAESKKAMGDWMEEEDEQHEERSSARETSRSKADRSERSERDRASSRNQGTQSTRRTGVSGRTDYEEDYEEDRESGRRTDADREPVNRSGGNRRSGVRSSGRDTNRASAERRNQERSRQIDDAYMNSDVDDEELDFD